MALTLKGLQGTVSDTDMATQLGAHHIPTVRSATDYAVAAVNGARTVSIAAGVADSAFLKVTNDAAAAGNLVLAPPGSGGKWYAITLDRQWSPTNSATLRADDLAVTDANGTIPTTIPSGALTATAALPNQPGTAGSAAGQRQVLALVYVRAADTTLTIFDMRVMRTGAGEVSVPSVHVLALLHAQAAVLEGAVIAVAPFTLSGALQLYQSLWIRNGGIFRAVSGTAFLIAGDGGNLTDIPNAGNALYTLQQAYPNAFTWPAGQQLRGSGTQNVWAWYSSAWTPWEGDWTGALQFLDTTANLDGTKSAQLRRHGRDVVLTLSVSTGANGWTQGKALLRLPAGFLMPGNQQHYFTVQLGYGNSYGMGFCFVQNDYVYWYQGANYGSTVRGDVGANQPVLGSTSYATAA